MENINKKKTLYVLIGVPASGKSFSGKKLSKENGALYISRDEVRFSMIKDSEEYFSKEDKVFREFIKRLQEGLDCGNSVIADATHTNRASRGKLLRALRLDKDTSVIGVYVKASFANCLGRNSKRNGRGKVPNNAMHSMYNGFVFPMLEEGFDSILTIDNNFEINI